MSSHRVIIEVENDTSIVCTESGGNVAGAQLDTVLFVGNGVEFTLAFTDFPSGEPAWPFEGSPPPPSYWPRAEFGGTLKKVPQLPVYYKYQVGVGKLRPLDPIIIVDK
jgi:hypothetical protein